MNELDGVLHRDDMIFPVFVGMVQHGRHGGGLAAACGPRHKDEPFVQHRSARQNGREPEVLGGQDLRRNLTEDRGATVLLVEKIGPITGHPGDFISKVHVSCFLEDLDLVFRRDLVQHRFEFVVFEHLVLDPLQLAVQPHHGLLAGHQMQVRGALFVHQFKERVYFGHGDSPFLLVQPETLGKVS